jgi:penicillin-binding protein 1A
MKRSKKIRNHKKQPRRVKTKTFWRGLIKFGLVGTIFIFLVSCVIAFFLFAYYSRDLPNVDEMVKKDLRPLITIKDANGIILAKYGDFLGDTLTYSQIPHYMVNAVIAAEDNRFFDHFGIDIFGVLRAQLVNLKEGRVVQGGSTITQQLAKIIFLSSERTIKRKIQEFIIALQLEKKFSKEQIISMYLNKVYLGKGNYGIDAASKFYFGKKAEDLNIFESAMLAGMLKAPSRYAPTNNPLLSVNRARYVVGKMYEKQFITKEEFSGAKPPRIIERGQARGALKNPYFTDYVLNEAYDLMENPNQNLTIYSTLDLRAQNILEEISAKHMKDAKQLYDVSQIAALVMEPTGAVKAMLGGLKYEESQYNRAFFAKRQPGSAFKLFVYLAAIENGIELSDVFEDKAISISQGAKLPYWSPKNFSNKYSGKMTMGQAFALSINTIAVQISESIGRDKTIEMAHRLGIRSRLQGFPSIALGAFGVSLSEMTQGFAHVFNNGIKTEAFGIIKITDDQNNILYEHPPYFGEVLLAQGTVDKMKSLLLSTVEYGTGKNARIPFKSVYGKTGTTQDHRDAWFIGSIDNTVTGIWVGNDDDSPMKKVSGGTLPAIIWRDYMQNVGDIPNTVLTFESIPWKFKGIFDMIFGGDSSTMGDDGEE